MKKKQSEWYYVCRLFRHPSIDTLLYTRNHLHGEVGLHGVPEADVRADYGYIYYAAFCGSTQPPDGGNREIFFSLPYRLAPGAMPPFLLCNLYICFGRVHSFFRKCTLDSHPKYRKCTLERLRKCDKCTQLSALGAFRVQFGCNLGAGRVHLYQTRSQHFRIHRNKLPVVRMLSAFYVLGVVLHLCLIAGQLFLAVGGNTSIGGHSLGTSRRRWHARQYSCSRRDHRYRPWSVQNRLYSVCFAHCATHSLLL